MREFAYSAATDIGGAVATLSASPGGRFLAGGTNLVDLMKLGVETPDTLVDVNRLGLDGIEETADGGLLIGAGVRNSDLAVESVIRSRYPVLSQALLAGASGQLRNMASTGGNLLQRTRCRYFTDVTQPCNKRVAGSGCPAREGDHRNLAIFGNSDACVATHPSDMAVALVALDAQLHLSGPAGDRVLPLARLHRVPADTDGDDVTADTVLEHAELITGIELPPLPAAVNSRYRKARDRASYAFATGSVAAVLDVTDGVVSDARIAWGAVAHRPWRATRAEEALIGRPATRDSFDAAALAELEFAEPLRDNGFKVQLLRSLTVATLSGLAGTAS